jgi:hypothetical protein
MVQEDGDRITESSLIKIKTQTMAQAKSKSVYDTLNEVPFKDKVETKGRIKYLSWAYAWDALKKLYPDAQRIVYECEATGFNYHTDGKTCWVKVGVKVGDLEHIDYLPVMDHRNQSIPVDKVNQFDVNKTIQRSTTKAIAMHGLGIQLWTGEDLPEEPKEAAKPTQKIKLEQGDENWEKVMTYVGTNYEVGFTKLTQQLGRKYTLPKATKDFLKAFIQKVEEKANE